MSEFVKYSTYEVADIVDYEGLGYTVRHYLSSDEIADPYLAELWARTASGLGEIAGILEGALENE